LCIYYTTDRGGKMLTRKGKKPTAERGTFMARTIDKVRKGIVLPIKRNVNFSRMYIGMVFGEVPMRHSTRKEEQSRTSDSERTPIRVEGVPDNTQTLRIGKWVTGGSIQRIVGKDVIDVRFIDESLLKVTIKAGSIKKMYYQDGERIKEIGEAELHTYFVELDTLSGFGIVPGNKEKYRPENDKLVFQSSSGESLVLEVEPGAIENSRIHRPIQSLFRDTDLTLNG
jgi:hypothetical protein